MFQQAQGVCHINVVNHTCFGFQGLQLRWFISAPLKLTPIVACSNSKCLFIQSPTQHSTSFIVTAKTTWLVRPPTPINPSPGKPI